MNQECELAIGLSCSDSHILAVYDYHAAKCAWKAHLESSFVGTYSHIYVQRIYTHIRDKADGGCYGCCMHGDVYASPCVILP